MTEQNKRALYDAEAATWLLQMHQKPTDARLHADWQQWLAQDNLHYQAWQRAQNAWQMAGQLNVSGNQLAPRRTKRLPRSAIAAVLSVLAVLAGLVAMPDQADYRTAGHIQTLSLEDGSTIYLDAETSMDVSFSAQNRHIELYEGQVYVSVASDPDRPFIIDAKGTKITVTGTAFAVSVLGSSPAISVAHGTVKISRIGMPEVTLSAGQQITDDHCIADCITKIDPLKIATWRSGFLIVNNQPLGEVLKQLARYRQSQIWLSSQHLAEHPLTGRFKLDDPDAAIRAALAPYQLHVLLHSPWLLVIGE